MFWDDKNTNDNNRLFNDDDDGDDHHQEEEDEEEAPEDSHPALSPAAGAESLFLAGLATANISANALAEQLRRNVSNPSYNSNNSLVSSIMSVATDDFVSAVENPDDLISVEEDDLDNDDNTNHHHETIPEIDTDSDTDESPEETTTIKSRELDFSNFNNDDTMAKKNGSTKTSAPATTTVAPEPKKEMKTPPPASTTSSDEPHVDAATHVYEHAKGIWSWGKGVPVVSTFLGVTEAVAGKVVEAAGTNLEEIDGNIKPQLESLDAGVLNPAIATLVGVLLGAAGRTEETVKPIIIMLLSPFGLIKNEAENPELTVTK